MVTVNSRMQQRRRTAAQWTSENPVLAAGEIGYVNDTDPPEFKIGDGTTAWNSLNGNPELAADDPAEVDLTTTGGVTTLTLLDTVARLTDRYKSGEYYYSFNDSYTAQALTLNTVYYVPVPLAVGTIDSIGLEVTTLGASAIARVGVYNDNAGLPSTRIAEAASTLDCSTTGAKTATISAAIPKHGLYWIAAVCQTAAISVFHGGRGLIVPMPLGTGVPSTNAAPKSRTQTGVTGALPSSTTLVDGYSGIAPRIHFRYT